MIIIHLLWCAGWYCRYRIHEQTAMDLVRIDQLSGEIISAIQLDHETSSFLRFHVLASDLQSDANDADQLILNGDHAAARVASALVIVAILNVDDQLPVFERPAYSLSVPENQPAMTLVGHVIARDADSPPFNELRYHLNGGVDADAFVLDPKTGSIRTRKMLDRERKSEYHVIVMAESVVGRGKRAFANVTVRVGDLNDHAPVVISPSGGNGTVHVTTSSLPGQLVTRIRAVDADLEPNGRLTYDWNSHAETETESAEPPPFRVDPQTGSVYVAAPLDDVAHGTTFRLSVVVRDNGIPPLASTANVYVVADREITGLEISRSGAAAATANAHDGGQEKFRFVLEGKFQLGVVIAVIVLCILVAGALLAAIVVCRRRRTRCPPEGAASDRKQGDSGGTAVPNDVIDGDDVILKPKVKPKPLAAIVTVSKNDRLQVFTTFSTLL